MEEMAVADATYAPEDYDTGRRPGDERLDRLQKMVTAVQNSLNELQSSLTAAQCEYLSINKAAVMCGLSPAHIRRAVVGGTLPCSNVGTADRPTYRISRIAVRQWMKDREAGPKPPPRKRKGNTDELQLPLVA
jgi:hypothetical protein